jgi:hypothetical protein
MFQHLKKSQNVLFMVFFEKREKLHFFIQI